MILHSIDIYFLTYELKSNKKNEFLDFYRTNCIKAGLDEFWKYKIHVVATAGSYSTRTETKIGQTKESGW
jgi:hypothetical protein